MSETQELESLEALLSKLDVADYQKARQILYGNETRFVIVLKVPSMFRVVF